jgi:hypothetical protein
MDIVITRPSLPPIALSRTNCQAILNDLVAREQAYIEQDGIVYWRMPAALGLFYHLRDLLPQQTTRRALPTELQS